MIGAKVNGKIVELSYTLHNGDIVEILTSAAERAPRATGSEWSVPTAPAPRSASISSAKSGRRISSAAKRALSTSCAETASRLSGEIYDQLRGIGAARFQLKDLDELYATIGYGGLTLSKIMPKLREEYRALRAPAKEPEKLDGEVPCQPRLRRRNREGIDNCLVKLSHCCNPCRATTSWAL